jgi:hypothetical protein
MIGVLKRHSNLVLLNYINQELDEERGKLDCEVKEAANNI